MDKDVSDPVYRRIRMAELFRPIEMQILMTDDEDDLIMLSTIMLTTAKDILIQRLGKERTWKMINRMERESKNATPPQKPTT